MELQPGMKVRQTRTRWPSRDGTVIKVVHLGWGPMWAIIEWSDGTRTRYTRARLRELNLTETTTK
jgi:hypothetical protein